MESIDFNGASIESIGSGAFAGCSKLGEVIINGVLYYIPAVEVYVVPDSVTEIADYAGSSNVVLKEVTISSTVSKYGTYLFNGCTNLQKVVLPSNITIINNNMFYNCTSLVDIEIPDTVTTIGKYAFYKAAITSLTVSESVDSIGDYAFAYCASLKTLDFKAAPSTMGMSCFTGCTLLDSVTLHDGLTKISNYMFDGCKSLATLELPSSLISIGDAAFRNTIITTLIVPEGVTTVGAAFYNCLYMTYVSLPSTVLSLGSYTFTNIGYYAEETITIVFNGPTTIGSYSFGSSALKLNLIFNENVTIMNRAYEGSNISVTANVAEGVGFSGYSVLKMEEVDGYVSVKLAGTDVVGKMLVKGGSTLNISKDCISIDPSLLNSSVTDIVVDSENPYYTYSNGFLKFNDTLVFVVSSESEIIVPEGIKTIGSGAFDGASQAGLIKFPASLECVKSNAVPAQIGKVVLKSTPALYPNSLGNNTELYFVPGTYDGSDLGEYTFAGYYVSAEDGNLFITVNDPVATLEVSEIDGTVYVSITLPDSYSDSILVAKLDGTVIEAVDGVYMIESLSGDQILEITGIKFNAYDVSIVSDKADVASPIGFTNIDMYTELTFSVIPKTGYTFGSEFCVTVNGEVLVPVSVDSRRAVFSIVVMEDLSVEISGIVAIETYVVSFDTDGATAISSVNVIVGNTVAVPVAPVKDRMSLAGWFIDAECTVLYDFETPVDADITLYAKWVAADNVASVTFDADTGTVDAYYSGDIVISSGEFVAIGTTVVFTYDGPLNYEIMGWIVNGQSVSDKSSTLALEITGTTTVTVYTTYTVQAGYVYVSDKESAYGSDATLLWSLKSPYGSYVSTSTIMGDHLYFKSGSYLCKVDIATGEVVDSVITGVALGFYAYPCAGNGMILDGGSGLVFDADLNPIFKIPNKDLKVLYHDGYFYLSDSIHIYKYAAADEDTSVSDNVQSPVWTAEANRYISTYQGQSHMEFTEKFILCIELGKTDSSEIWLSTFDIETGEKIDSVQMEKQYGTMLNAGYLSYYDGYAYLTVYSSGLFDSSVDVIYNLGRVALDENGYFNDVDMSYLGFGHNSYSSSAIVVGDYLYLLSGTVLYVLDSTTLEIVTSASAEMSHGNIAVSTGYDGKVIIYEVPYNSTKTLRAWVHDLSSPEVLTEVSMTNIINIAQYGSQQVHFGSNGEIIYFNDSGYTFCIVRNVAVSAEVIGNGTLVITDSEGNVVEEESVSVIQGTVATVDGNTLIIGGYTFTVTPVDSDDVVVWNLANGERIGADLVLKATFRYNVSFTVGDEIIPGADYDYGTSADSISVPVVFDYDDETAVYTFVGWEPAIAAVTGNVVYSAVFDVSVKTFTVTYVIGDTEIPMEIPAGTVIVPFAPSKVGYTFVGWEGYTVGMVATSDVTFTAVFEPIAEDVFTVTIVYNDGTSATVEVKKGDVIDEPKQVYRYYKDPEMTVVWSSLTKIYKDVTVYAMVEAEGVVGESAVWSLDFSTGTLTVSGTGATYDWSAKTAPWYAYRYYITGLTVDEGITYLGSYACYKYPYLNDIVLSDSLVGIGKYALVSSAVDHILIGSGLKDIGVRGIYGMTFLEGETEIAVKAYALASKEFYGSDGVLYLDNIHGDAADVV